MKKFRFYIVIVAVLGYIQILSACGNEKTTSAKWHAETVVSEEDVEAAGLDNWFEAEEISDDIFARMWLKSWKEECPLDRADLRYLKVLHIFRRLYEAGYRIERMVLIDNYEADDEAAMRANNSSSFNFRFMTGSTTKISKHGMGLAIDINPLYNPYVKNTSGKWHIEPAAGSAYAFDRDSRTDIPYKIDHDDLAYRLFIEAGFQWGGDWISLKDYQHFEIDLK